MLAAIAVFKLLKAALLFAVGFGLIKLLSPGVEPRLVHWAHSLAWSYDRGIVQQALTYITGLDDKHLRILGFGAYATGAVFTVEGIGLWFAKRWAEYLTLAVTASLLPVEIFELFHKFSYARLSGLGLNVAIVAYLVLLVRRNSASRSPLEKNP